MNILPHDKPEESEAGGRVPNRLIAEQGTLFASIVKWAVLASIVGLMVGSVTSLFLYLLGLFVGVGNKATSMHAYWLLPIVMPAVVLIIKKLAPSAEGHGTEKVIEAIHRRDGEIDIKVVPVKLFATLITLGAGGSVGKEGPAAQIGAGLAYAFSRIIRLNRLDAKRLVICGISAGFASVFGTPISGAIFGAEVLYLGLLQYDVMFPCLVAGVVAHMVCRAGNSAPVKLSPSILPQSHTEAVFISLLSGIFFGVVALVFIWILSLAERLHSRIKLNVYLKAALAGVALIGVFTISPASEGLGLNSTASVLAGGHVPIFTALWKSVATSITLGFGGSGGIITPLFVVGATSGSALAYITGLSGAMLGAFGMVALVAACANTPIAAAVMALELFGRDVGTYAAIACLTAYIVVGHRSVYPSQILGASKSASIEIAELSARIDEAPSMVIHPRKRSLLYLVGRLTRSHKRESVDSKPDGGA